ncbi:NAD-dependent epimerase/dehydratase family protein [Altererythrobacter sp. MF3-039]|uniref:NAD-dependent epimerase/dehydratase family protein n=1 Tax=Altererythrobacter sp. MF3-039 TaxID=3252901 RepID=UPI00390CB718
MTPDTPIALTGGTGFVGQAVCDLVEEQGLRARALARRVPDADRKGIEWLEGDLANPHALATLCEGADAVIHIAGLTNTPDPEQFDAVNVAGTQAVLDAARANGIKRFILVSSLSAREPKLSRYGASKAKAEELVQGSGLDWTIVRPPAVYGPRDIDMFELFRSAKWGVVPLPPCGATSIIHVHDLAHLLLNLIPNVPSLRRKIFEPDDAREGGWSHKELGKAIGEAMGRRVFAPHLPASVLRAAAGVDRILRMDNAKLTPDRVGYMTHPNWIARSDRAVPVEVWQPRIPGVAGLKQTAEWYRENGWL